MPYSSAVYDKIKSFMDRYGNGVQKAISNTGLYFPAVIAQSALESGYGNSIPKDSFNFGGIKYNPSLDGVIGYVESDTTEYVNGVLVSKKQKFSKFKDAESGFKAHIQVLLKDRYKNAVQSAKSPYEQIFYIAQAGYTTTPAKQYADTIRPLIEASIDYAKSSGKFPTGKVEAVVPKTSSKFPILAVVFIALGLSAGAYFYYRKKL
jgi:flagellum-specific peptidoglycan hydrolase FlgJ